MAGTAPPHIVVVGSGLAGYGVLRELRRLSKEAELTLVTRDDGHFYSKPALSTALAKGKTPDSLITTPGAKMAAQLRLDLRAGTAAEAIDRDRRILLTTGGPVAYDALVLALGANPTPPPLKGDGADLPFMVNSLHDYAAFRDGLRDGARVLILGSGLVGTEFANDLSAAGYRPVVVDMLGHPLAQLIPPEVGETIRDALERQGVTWHLGRSVEAIYRADRGACGVLDNGVEITADVVLSAIGIRPRTALAERAGLHVARGIKVDATGRSSDPHIYAIGDCAEYVAGPAAYVTPIMAAARAIARGALGTPTPIRFPTLSVQVKTTACPVILLPAPRDVAGSWDRVEDDEAGLKYLFRDRQGAVRGYVLTRGKCEARAELDRSLAGIDTNGDGA